MLISLQTPIFLSTHQIQVKLDHIERTALKCYGARGPKRGIKMNEIPKSLWSPRLVLKNPSISFPPNNSNHFETSGFPKNIASNGASQAQARILGTLSYTILYT